jgi:hypothetical protein
MSLPTQTYTVSLVSLHPKWKVNNNATEIFPYRLFVHDEDLSKLEIQKQTTSAVAFHEAATKVTHFSKATLRFPDRDYQGKNFTHFHTISRGFNAEL